MVSRSSVQRLLSNRTARGALALLVLLCARVPLFAQAARLNWDRSDNLVQPVTLSADAVASWNDQDRRVVLLQGKVFLNQGLIQARMEKAVVWIDTRSRTKTGNYQMEVYGEGATYVVDGSKIVTGDQPPPQVFFTLTTRADVKISAYASKVVEQAFPGDQLFQRGSVARSGPAPGGVMTAGGPVAPGGIRQTAAQQVTPLPPVAPTPVVTPLPPVAPTPVVTPTPAVPAVNNQVPGVPVQQLQPLFQPPNPPDYTRPPVLPPPGQKLPEIGPLPKAVPLDEAPPGPRPRLIIQPNSSTELKARNFPQPNGETAVVVTGGIILTVISPNTPSVVDIEADRLVFWTQGDFQKTLNGLRSAGSDQKGESNKAPEEFYLSGNVQLRSKTQMESRLIRAEEVYYHTGKNVAIALNFDLELTKPGMQEPMHVKGPELVQVNSKVIKFGAVDANASKLPYDPALYIGFSDGTITEKTVPKTSIFGAPFLDPKTGQPEQETQRIFEGRNFVLYLAGVPIFYLPYLAGNVNDPLGPLDNISFNYNKIFGFQLFTTWDLYELLGMDRVAGTRWQLLADVMTARGPALGSTFTYSFKDMFGIPSRSTGVIKAYGISDGGDDQLGGARGQSQYTSLNPVSIWDTKHPDLRGRLFIQNNTQDLPMGFSLKYQISALSDRNFLEQYYLQEFQRDLNQETFLYAQQQLSNWNWSVLVEPRLRNWVTETEWLPKLEGHLIGEKFFDLFTYNIRGSVGYAHLLATHDQTGPLLTTDQTLATGRADLWQELSLPFYVGAFKVVPYGVIDLTYYTKDLTGDDVGRLYAAGGVRTSLPLSRLYADVQSDLFNLNGLYHKIVLSGNLYAAHSSVSYKQLPQLDRVEDDASDQALRDIRPFQPYINTKVGQQLVSSPLYDPQQMLIRRLNTNLVDTLDSVEVLQADIRQRWQTKRGFPGMQHVVDWMTLDVSASFFPNSNRDNFGHPVGFLEYDWLWNIGDRTSLFSSGWFDPFPEGARVFTVGGQLNRPDQTNLSLAYRQIDPLNSKSVIASLSYPFSNKYAITASTSYDFGANVRSSSFFVTRTGPDLQVNFGLSQSSVLNTVSVFFEVYPNLLPANRRAPGSGGALGGPGGLLSRGQ